MKPFLKILVLLLFMLPTYAMSQEAGRKVTISLKDSLEKKGELLSVRDSLVSIIVKPVLNNGDIYYSAVQIAKFDDFNRIVVEDNHALLINGGTGVAIGGGILLGLAADDGDSPNSIGDALGQALVGMVATAVAIAIPVAGVVAGTIRQKNEESFIFDRETPQVSHTAGTSQQVFWQEGINLLRQHARFKEYEPPHVREIIDLHLKEVEEQK